MQIKLTLMFIMKSLFRKFMFFVLLSAKGLYASGSGQVTEKNFVFTAQFILEQLGYNVGTVDGLYGPKTGNALREFYHNKGITDVDEFTFDESDLNNLISIAVKLEYRLKPLSGVINENSNPKYLYPPKSPGVTEEKYWFGHFWSNYDFNNDGLLDFVYTGTMKPNNIDVTGEDTAGLCGGNECNGTMPGPTLYLQIANGSFDDRSDLFVDKRNPAGHSLARQNIVADFNNDDILDLFIADHAIGHHRGIRDSYFLSQTDGTWIESSSTHLSDPAYVIFDHGAAVGDIDSDGDIDIVLTELANRITCWMNDGTGYLSKKKCGDVNAFSIELGDMDGDGDLDLVHAGHEYGGSSPTGIAFNNGAGKFKRKIKLPVVKKWGTVPELSLWDLDTDGDLDIVFSRSGKLYVGTGLQILENMGGQKYKSVFYPIIEAPDTYVATHEGNEWNNFVEHIRFHDINGDGLTDIGLVGGGSVGLQNAFKVRGAYFENNGQMKFRHVSAKDKDNHVLRVPNSLFLGKASSGRISSIAETPFGNVYAAAFDKFVKREKLSNLDVTKFQVLDEPITLSKSGATILGMANLSIHQRKLAGKYDVLLEWAGRKITATICQEYYQQYDFLATRVVFGADQGFGGLASLQKFGTNSCPFFSSSVAVGAWEVDSSIAFTGIDAILEDLNESNIGIELIVKMPMLNDEQRSSILSQVRK